LKQAYRWRADVAYVVIRAHIIAHNNKQLKYHKAAKNSRLRYQLFIISRSIRTTVQNLMLGRIFSRLQSKIYLTGWL